MGNYWRVAADVRFILGRRSIQSDLGPGPGTAGDTGLCGLIWNVLDLVLHVYSQGEHRGSVTQWVRLFYPPITFKN